MNVNPQATAITIHVRALHRSIAIRGLNRYTFYRAWIADSAVESSKETPTSAIPFGRAAVLAALLFPGGPRPPFGLERGAEVDHALKVLPPIIQGV